MIINQFLKEHIRPLHQSNNVVETIVNHPQVITMFIGGMVTIPKWVVYDIVLTTWYLNQF